MINFYDKAKTLSSRAIKALLLAAISLPVAAETYYNVWNVAYWSIVGSDPVEVCKATLAALNPPEVMFDGGYVYGQNFNPVDKFNCMGEIPGQPSGWGYTPLVVTINCGTGYYDRSQKKCTCLAADQFPKFRSDGYLNCPTIIITESVRKNPGVCRGNPVDVTTGAKIERIRTGLSIGGSELTLSYDTKRFLFSSEQEQYSPNIYVNGFSKGWYGNFHKRMARTKTGYVANRGDGRTLTFPSNGNGWPDADIKDTYSPSLGYRDFDAKVHEYYQGDVDQIISSTRSFDGTSVISFEYSTSATPPSIAPSPGYLIKATDQRGQTISFLYKSVPEITVTAEPRLVRAEHSSGMAVDLQYGSDDTVISVTWTDGVKTVFKYDDVRFPWAMTSKSDENGVVWGEYAYGAQGNAISTSGPGGVRGFNISAQSLAHLTYSENWDTGANKIYRHYQWEPPIGLSVVDSSTAETKFNVSNVLGALKVTEQSQAAGSGCSAASRKSLFDARGNEIASDDFLGNRTCRSFNSNLPQELVRVEGLPSSTDCSLSSTFGTALPAGSRKITTSYDNSYGLRLEKAVARPGRIITRVYNGGLDPETGQGLRCAPNTATLPGNVATPIAVLCKEIEQATLDDDGSKGFSAALDNSVPSRVQQWTYNQAGQVLTYKDPRNNVTVNSYYGDTTADHTVGDLQSITNAKQQITTFSKYNTAGQWLEMTDPNGIVTTRTFDSRQRVKTVTTSAATTNYEYWPTGLVKKVTLPDSSSLSYGYDVARRLTSITDNLGNTITYTLDNSGNRIGEDVRDPIGTLAKTLTRVPDALNRIQQVTGRP